MQTLYLLTLLALIPFTGKSQSLKKVSGVKYIGASYGIQSAGFNVGVNFDNYFKKDFAYSLQLSFENHTQDNFSLTDVYLSGGGKNYLGLPVKNLYIGGGYGSYFGKQFAKQTILNDNSESWIWGLYLNPMLEYYVFSSVALNVSYTQFFDFNNDFRNYHYSLNVGFAISF